MAVAWLSGFVSGLVILGQAFGESLVWGLCYLLVPLAALVFVAMHWDKTKYAFVWSVGASLLTTTGAVVMLLFGGSFEQAFGG